MTALQADDSSLGQYEIRRILGEGGFGQVLEAWDTKLRRPVAIKRLKPELLSARPDNLLDEARLAASLRHSAFVKIFSIEGDAAQQSIIMEYVDGVTLRQQLREGAMDEAAARDVLCQVAEAMDEAHAAHLIHGDLKPSNLMLEVNGKVRIMDFGLARKLDPEATEVSLPEEATGTIAYLAPELLMGMAPNAQSDIYALGVVLYEMVTGARPFPHLSGLSLAAATIQSSSDVWPFPPGCSPAMAQLVRAMTARDLSQRLPSMQAVWEAARSAPGSLPLASPPARVGQRVRASLLRRPAVLWGAAALALAAVLAQVTVSTEWGRAHSPFFSEAAAMREGLAALRTFDRDESVSKAIAQFNAILAHKPDHAAAAAGLSLAYALRYAGDGHDAVWLQRADASAQLAMRQNDQLALSYVALGGVRHLQGQREQALHLLDRAIGLDPTNRIALTNRAEILLSLGQADKAEQAMRAAIKSFPNDRCFRDMYGMIEFQRGHYKEAEALFRQSIKIEPDAVIAYANLSAALLRQGRPDEALAMLQQGLQIRPSGQLYSNLGNVLFNRGDYVAAAAAFEHATSASSGNASTYVRWANLADTLRWIPGREDASRKAYKEAITLLAPILQHAPNDARLQSRMGLYLARTGDLGAARDLAGHAQAGAADNGDVQFRVAMTYEICGERDKAMAALQSARRLAYPENLISAEPDLLALRRDPRYRISTNEGVK